MRLKFLIKLRKGLKNPKKVKKMIEEIKKEIVKNDREYKMRDKELRDYLAIIEVSQKIISNQEEVN